MPKIPANDLSELESTKHLRVRNDAANVERLLQSLGDATFRAAASLIRFHDALLFLCAFPQSRKVVRKTERLLQGWVPEVARLRKSGANMDPFDSEQVSGIAGTELRDTFTYDVARWLTRRYPRQVRAVWDIDEQSRALSAALPRFVPLLQDDSLVEADTPYLTWLSRAAGAGRELEWFLQQLHDSPLSPPHRTTLYNALALQLHCEWEDCPASRTLTRRPRQH